MSADHEEVFSTEMLIHSLLANAAEESRKEVAGILIILADRLADLTAALADRDRRLAALEAELERNLMDCCEDVKAMLVQRADRAEAIVRGLREWLTQAFGGEIRAHDIAFIEGDLTVVRVRRGRANLVEDALAKLDELEGR